jgi:LPXTG-motif cell wall-anchored protein
MKYRNFSFCLICCLGLFFSGSYAQQVKVSAKLDKTSILLGDQTVLRLSATLPAKDHINFPVLSDTLSAKVQIVEQGRADTVKDQNNPALRTITRQYTITSFEAGVQVIPSLTFESTTGKLQTDPLPLQVQEVKVDTTKAIYDIKQPIAVSYGLMDWLRDNWYWVLAGVLLIAAAAALWFYFRKRKKPEFVVIEAPKPVVPPHVLALEKLHSLKDKKLWQQDQAKQYHIELTDIVREFLEQRYQIRAMEQTSEEIFASLRPLELSEQNRNRLRQMLMLADLVKFAKATPLNTDNEQSMDNAIDFVKETGAMNPFSEPKTPEV